jgi:hypothetical protein
MSELLQEFVDSRQQRLRVDRDGGVIRGVKLLGLASRNGRRYREEALVSAVGLYEGAKVNINHPKGHPLSPRDYQDRLGVVRSVQFRAGEGLFGDLHFNPKHALSEQLVWDAEHAPQNVGMSHNVLARTSRSGDDTVVETITKVQSIDLVADPATTNGLYEHTECQESRNKSQEPEDAGATRAGDTRSTALDSLTLEQLREQRPDLIAELEQEYGAHLEEARNHLDAMLMESEAARRRERIEQLLEQYDLPLPSTSASGPSQLVSSQFIDTLMRTDSDERVQQLIEERAELVRSACEWRGQRRLPAPSGRPRSRDQLALQQIAERRRTHTAQEFAAAILR